MSKWSFHWKARCTIEPVLLGHTRRRQNPFPACRCRMCTGNAWTIASKTLNKTFISVSISHTHDPFLKGLCSTLSLYNTMLWNEVFEAAFVGRHAGSQISNKILPSPSDSAISDVSFSQTAGQCEPTKPKVFRILNQDVQSLK